MNITWHGQYTTKIITQGTTLVLDPHDKIKGRQAFRGRADIVALSNPESKEMSHLDGIQGEPMIIDTPGEYSVSGMTLHATSWHGSDGTERSLQRWHIEHMIVLHLGALDRKLSDAELQQLEQTDIDILLLPVSNNGKLSTKDALSMLTVIEPRVVIPINFESAKEFAGQMGISATQAQPKFTINRSKLPDDGMESIILST
jgi:L-ascorbate metabolism protein UlaG (beta-lactamase superfamily)